MIFSKKYFLLFLSAFITLSAFSQQGSGRRHNERIKEINARKIAFITERLSLSPEEAQVFWPVYNKYNELHDSLMQEHRLYSGRGESVSQMTKEEAAEFAEREVERFEESAIWKREFHEELKKVLSIEKIALLYEAERDFNKMIFREARQRWKDRN